MVGYFILFLFVSIVAAVTIYFLIRLFRRRRIQSGISFVLLLVRVQKDSLRPQDQNTPGRDFKSEITKSEQLFANLSSINQPFCFEVAVPHVGEDILFHIAVPRRFVEITIKQIQGIWNTASVTVVQDDYNIFNPSGASAAVYISQREHYALPFRTYQEVGLDTFSSIVGSFSKISDVGEGAAFQVIMEPAGSGPKRKILRYISELKKGKELKHVLGFESKVTLKMLKDLFFPQSSNDAAKINERTIIDEDGVKALEAKIAKPLFVVNARIIASAPSIFQAQDIVQGIASGFTQLSAPRRNELRIVKPRAIQKLLYDFSFRILESSQVMILNTEEIASFFHLPTSTIDTPRIKWLKSKEAPAPSNVSTTGTRLGVSVFRGQEKPIYLSDSDRERHLYVVGQTGTGKSTFLGDMIMEDIIHGKGLAIIDPHGDLVEAALAHVPAHRLDDVIYFNPGDLWRPIGLNMLEYNFDRPEEKTFIVNEMMSIFSKLFPPETLGPMFEQYMRNALLLLMEDMPNESATLMEVPRVFTDTAYRTRKLERISNPVVIDFWSKEANKVGGDASLANMTPYITSKFNNFTANDYMRPIIGQNKSAFNFRTVMDEGKILFVNLSKGKIGDINANLLGMIFTGKLLMSALSRVDIESENRRTFNLYIDEFQNFTTDSISIILSEARKYKLTLNIAHQFIAQLTEKIRDSVFGNVGSQVVFRVGAQDAEFLVKQFDPVFTQQDLMNIDNRNAYVKLLVQGETTKPFNMRVEGRSLLSGDLQRASQIKEYCRMKYGANRQEVEADIFRRLRE
jgi:hypothetical protein